LNQEEDEINNNYAFCDHFFRFKRVFSLWKLVRAASKRAVKHHMVPRVNQS